MNKELEVLNDLRSWFTIHDENAQRDLNIIETALKDYELMKQTKIIVADKKISNDDLEKLKNQRMLVGSLEQCEIKPLFDKETQKKLKALEIIKEKKVDIKDLYKTLSFYLMHPDCELKEYIYYNSLKTAEERLTEDQYDLLKEVLYRK